MKADLEISSNKSFKYSKLLTTKVNYQHNDKGRPLCKGECRDTCAGAPIGGNDAGKERAG